MLSNRSNLLRRLPKPTIDGLRLSHELTAHIKNLIAEQDGTIGFDQYMNACLYAPGLGYYSAGSRKFGRHGDFVTAPEISPLFAKCLANQWTQILAHLGESIILELGAGTGALACDLLLQLERQDALPSQYWILEVSADLRQRQQTLIAQTIPALCDRVQWLDTLPCEPFTGLILANEVLDAQPVKRFVKTNGDFQEMKVAWQDKQFIWSQQSAQTDLLTALYELEQKHQTPLPEAYRSEINLNLKKWLSAITAALNNGVILFIDYGYTASEYYHPQRNDGTLLCHYRHHVHADPFLYPGLQDITTSVNFTAVAEVADSLGLDVCGYTTQAYFLFACGLENLLADMGRLDPKTQVKAIQQVQILTSPEEMGERFRVIALGKNFDQTMTGFTIMDQRIRL